MSSVDIMNPKSCDTFVVLPPLTQHGGIIFGKNSDRPNGEVQEIIYCPACEYKPGDKLQCTYITIDQVRRTHAVILSKPSWMWGAEMGANDHGVVIGNEAVWTKLSSKDDIKERLLGMDMLRLALERASTSEEAVDVLTELLDIHGQGGPCSDEMLHFTYHNSFLIADPREAWVLETAGSEWAAERITAGCRNISNNLTIGTNIHRHSPMLKGKAKQLGFWNGKGDFHFASAYGNYGSISCAYGRQKSGEDLLHKLSEGNNFRVSSMFTVLRDEESGICCSLEDDFPTMGSQVSLLSPTDLGKPHCHWFTATPDPKLSIFKPFIFTSTVETSLSTKSPEYEPDPAKVIPRFKSRVDRRHLLYKCHQDTSKTSAVMKMLQELERKWVNEIEQFVNNFSENQNLEKYKSLLTDTVENELCVYLNKS